MMMSAMDAWRAVISALISALVLAVLVLLALGAWYVVIQAFVLLTPEARPAIGHLWPVAR
jgi:uncharacterized membrane protein